MDAITDAIGVTAWLRDPVFDNEPGWERPSCITLLEDPTAEQAPWRPAQERRHIWDLVLRGLHWRGGVAHRMKARLQKHDRQRDLAAQDAP